MGDQMVKEKKAVINSDDLLMGCLNDLNQVIEAYEYQTKIIQSYHLDLFQETEQSKVKFMEIYTINLETMLSASDSAKPFSKKNKEIFLKSVEKLKEVMLTNTMVLEATKKTKEHIMNIYKKYIEEELNIKSYGYKGKIVKNLSTATFFESI
jgi:hypothetical protein